MENFKIILFARNGDSIDWWQNWRAHLQHFMEFLITAGHSIQITIPNNDEIYYWISNEIENYLFLTINRKKLKSQSHLQCGPQTLLINSIESKTKHTLYTETYSITLYGRRFLTSVLFAVLSNFNWLSLPSIFCVCTHCCVKCSTSN